MTAVEAVHRAGEPSIDQQMLLQLAKMPTARSLPDGFLNSLYKTSSEPLRERAQEVALALTRPAADVQAVVKATLAKLEPGDPVRGLQIFRGSKAACSACHKMGYVGNNIGPVLTRIGRSRTREALLEAILFPSSRLEQSYQSTRVLTTEGKVFSGLIRNQNADEIELQLNADRTITIPTDQIEQLAPSDVSVMPSGLDELLTDQELADLLALLESAR
jgi:putative heme-binding domain-containing protein